VIEYRDANGDLHYIETVSRPGAHAEELAVVELQRLRIPPANVTKSTPTGSLARIGVSRFFAPTRGRGLPGPLTGLMTKTGKQGPTTHLIDRFETIAGWRRRTRYQCRFGDIQIPRGMMSRRHVGEGAADEQPTR
jgi:hypothetical protein